MKGCLLATLSVLLFACASVQKISLPITPSKLKATGSLSQLQYIYIVHGDGGYIYYDKAGFRHFADQDAVDQALFVAHHTLNAEVFVFHQSRHNRHLFRPSSDGRFSHFENGVLMHEQEYARNKKDGPGFGSEAKLLRQYILNPNPAHRVLLYFGHEIPAEHGKSYSQTHPELGFSMPVFALGLENFTGPIRKDKRPFDLIVLSTCHGGSPRMTRMLSAYTPYLLASPAELHLSFLDTRVLVGLKAEGDEPGREWGKRIAEASFTELKENTNTVITLALYHEDSASAYLDAHRQGWEAFGSSPDSSSNFMDCRERAGFGQGGAEAGITLYYRPPRFGREQGKSGHSGWECSSSKVF